MKLGAVFFERAIVRGEKEGGTRISAISGAEAFLIYLIRDEESASRTPILIPLPCSHRLEKLYIAGNLDITKYLLYTVCY